MNFQLKVQDVQILLKIEMKKYVYDLLSGMAIFFSNFFLKKIFFYLLNKENKLCFEIVILVQNRR